MVGYGVSGVAKGEFGGFKPLSLKNVKKFSEYKIVEIHKAEVCTR